MKKIVEYQVVSSSGHNHIAFGAIVDELISDGWIPHGGIVASEGYLYQAMAKYLDPEEFFDEKQIEEVRAVGGGDVSKGMANLLNFYATGYVKRR